MFLTEMFMARGHVQSNSLSDYAEMEKLITSVVFLFG